MEDGFNNTHLAVLHLMESYEKEKFENQFLSCKKESYNFIKKFFNKSIGKRFYLKYGL